MDADCKNLMVTMLVSFGKGCVTGGAVVRHPGAGCVCGRYGHALSVVSLPQSLLEDLGGEQSVTFRFQNFSVSNLE